MARWPMSCKHWLIEYFHWLGSEHAGSKLNFKEHSNKVHISHSNKENEHEHIKAMFLLTSVTPQSTAQANKISLRSLWSGSLSCRNHDVTAKTLLCRALIGLDLIYCYLALPFLWITRDFFSLHIQIYARLYNAAASWPRPFGLGCSLAIICKLRHFVNSQILIQLYYAIIYPFLTMVVLFGVAPTRQMLNH